MTGESERKEVLKMIEDGLISPQQGLDLLRALDDGNAPADEDEQEAEQDAEQDAEQQAERPAEQPELFGAKAHRDLPPHQAASASYSEEPAQADTPIEGDVIPDFPPPPDFGKWQLWWQIPLWIGVGLTVLAGLLMFAVYQASGAGFWFACTWFPFLLGVGIMALAWGSRKLRWLHLRVHQKGDEWPRVIAISLPLPLRLGAWAVRTFGSRIPNMDAKGLDQMILALEHTTPEAPLYLRVNDDDDGEQVEIFIG